MFWWWYQKKRADQNSIPEDDFTSRYVNYKAWRAKAGLYVLGIVAVIMVIGALIELIF